MNSATGDVEPAGLLHFTPDLLLFLLGALLNSVLLGSFSEHLYFKIILFNDVIVRSLCALLSLIKVIVIWQNLNLSLFNVRSLGHGKVSEQLQRHLVELVCASEHVLEGGLHGHGLFFFHLLVPLAATVFLRR
uniref:Uncharacterized protein n=1 Tax=Strombidium inclinatum TaxID=197538 RepID=A0A7S3MY33_9SPIT